MDGERNSAQRPCVSFLETRNAQGGTFLFLGNEIREKSGFVSYVSLFLCFDFDPKYSGRQENSII